MMTQARDMTDRQFRAACKRHGLGEIGPLGYVDLGEEAGNVNVSVLNANSLRKRTILAYLLRRQKRAIEKYSDR